MSDITIESNAAQLTDVTIPDMGLVIEAAGGSTVLDTRPEKALALNSEDLLILTTDDAHGANSSTLILLDGTDEVPQASVEAFLNGTGGLKTVFAPINLSNATRGDFNVSSIPKNSSGNLTFNVPEDFTSLSSIEAIGIPEASETGANIDLSSTYANIGEVFNNHSESDSAVTFDLTADLLNALDISSIFTSLAAGDKCGLFIDHKNIAGKVDYLGVKLVYR